MGFRSRYFYSFISSAWRLSVLAFASALGGGAVMADQGDEPGRDTLPADLVLTNGAIYTVDAARSWAEAVAIRDGEFIFVGRNDGVTTVTGANTLVIDLEGRMVIPGMQDAHVHPISGGMEALACDLNAANSVAEYQSTVRTCAEKDPDGTWIFG
ncbi:MAG: amidohydrolase family protein, partial [Xanthomonadales bacterium]|nr:amidohydrolase family protein [Xanthomonadales bacterium]